MRRLFFDCPRAGVFTFLFIFLATVNYAQFRAGIQGTITDSSGAVVPGAKVTVTSLETEKTQQTTSSNDGFYSLTGLPPGRYKVVVERENFKRQELENVIISAEATQGVDVVLTPGAVSETMTVSAEAAQTIQTENANVDRGITETEVRQLPQFGRDPYELLRLTPGIFGTGARSNNGGAANLPNAVGPGGSSNSIFQTENQAQISANGQRVSSNNFQIDGVSVNSFNWGGAALVTPNQESVKEIRVLSSTYSAEDGRNSGAQIRVVSQNGTNEWHGSGFFKYNSPKLNAYNKYGGPGAQPIRINNYIRQFGGSFGGPLYFPHFGEGGRATMGGPNKSFFFFSYEGLRSSSNNVGRAYVETSQFRQLVLQQRLNTVTAQVLAASGIEPRIINVIAPSCGIFNNDPLRCRVVGNGLDIGSLTGATGQYVASAQGGGLDNIPDIQEVQFELPGQTRGNQYNVRLDFTPTERDTVTFSTYITRQNNLGSFASSQSRPNTDLPFKPLNLSGTVLYNRIFSSTLFNEIRFNATRFKIDQEADATNTNFGIPRVEIEGLPISDRIRFGVDRGEGTPGIFAQNIFELSDTLSKTLGNHSWKFGVVLRNEQDNSDLSGGSRPLYSFSGLFNFANSAPVFESINADPVTGLPADAQRYFRNDYYAGFVQDDWKVRPSLTLNLGLRYEYFSPLKEKNGRLSNLFFTPGNLATAQVRVVDQLYEPDKNNFAPRFGFAYSPNWSGFGNFLNSGRSVIRGGFGVAFNRLPVAPLNNSRGNPPFFARYNICCGTAGSPFANGQILYVAGTGDSVTSYPRNPALGLGIDPTTGAPRSGSVEIYGTPQDMRTPYVYTYSLEVQQELGRNFTATVGYQGSAGHKLLRLVNQNFLYPNSPSFFAVYFSQPDVNSNYNALNVTLTRRLTQGFQIQGNYRFAKSIDQLSSEGPGFVTNQTYPQDNRTERGPSDFDVKHYFVLSSLYELPFLKDRRDLLGSVFGGWMITGILTTHTGFPFTPVVGGCTSTPGGPQLCPVRPQGYTGPDDLDTSNDAFISGANFPGGGAPFFVVTKQANGSIAPPGIGRNSFRGPNYFNVDTSFVKMFRFGSVGNSGEGAFLELRANFFNVFNKLNLAPFTFGSNAVTIGNFDAAGNGGAGVVNNNPNFGRANAGLAGRVVELQARLRF